MNGLPPELMAILGQGSAGQPVAGQPIRSMPGQVALGTQLGPQMSQPNLPLGLIDAMNQMSGGSGYPPQFAQPGIPPGFPPMNGFAPQPAVDPIVKAVADFLRASKWSKVDELVAIAKKLGPSIQKVMVEDQLVPYMLAGLSARPSPAKQIEQAVLNSILE